jgi:L-lactate utilization protein LutC
VHLALLPQRRIVPTPGDLLRGWSEERLEVLGSNVVLITGPSRSADIELQLTVGVHGPERVLIALV